jgi:hypothetical protein
MLQHSVAFVLKTSESKHKIQGLRPNTQKRG